MAQTLTQIAQSLKNADKKVQLIYAFNGSGKTRLSREFRLLADPKRPEGAEEAGVKVMYYNAFTEDLFFWDNDLEGDANRRLTIRPNNFTSFALQFLKDQGLDGNIVTNFQRYTSDSITPKFSPDFSEVEFSIATGDDQSLNHVKISKGEESNFIWCVFYSLLEQVVELLNTPEADERASDQFNALEYVFIDDPVSSLDDTHLIELAVDIAGLIKSSRSELKFIITTHNPLFYNVLFNEFNRVRQTRKWRLEKLSDGTFSLLEQSKDSPFSYHLALLSELEKAVASGTIEKYHFNFLRNILEKTSTFLGFNNWEKLLPEESRESYYKRIINLSSHSKHHGEEVSILHENDKRVLTFLVNEVVIKKYHFRSIISKEAVEENASV